MGPTITLLLSFGLCLNWEIEAQIDSFPRPTLWADPTPVVPKGTDVTLRCQGQLGEQRFQLWQDGELREERHESQHLGEFVLREVDDERDARSYSCRYGQGNLWSEFSEPLALVVMTGEFLRPSISIAEAPPIHQGIKVTICCQGSPMDFSQQYNFVLLEAGSLEPLQQQSSVGTQAHFSLQSVRAEDTGSYSCIYYQKTAPHRGSHPSESLMMTVLGMFPKPTLWAQPALIVDSGANLTLWCSRPKLLSLKQVTFSLSKDWSRKPLQQRSSGDVWTEFLLPSVRPEDSGSYSCAYRSSDSSAGGSEPSEALELVVPGSLPRPSLSALPGFVVEPGTHVTLQCRQPPQSSLWRVTFILLKQGSPKPLQTQSPAGPSADFHLFSMRAQDSGNYSCVYHGSTAPYQVSELSEALEIQVTDALSKCSLSAWPREKVPLEVNMTPLCQGPSWSTRFVPPKKGSKPCNTVLSDNTWTQCNNTILALSCVSFLLLLCLFFLAFLCHQYIHMGSLQGDSSRRGLCCPCIPWETSLSHNADVSREEALYTEVEMERQGEPLVSMPGDRGGVTYAHLNIKTVKKNIREPLKANTQQTLYTSVSEPERQKFWHHQD